MFVARSSRVPPDARTAGPPNSSDGPPNCPDGPPNGSGRRSRRPSAPTVQPNQTKNNNTPTIASLGYTGPSYISDWGRIYHLYIRPWPIYPSPKMIYCLYIVYVWKKYTENIGKSRLTRIATEKSNSCSHWRELHFSNENYISPTRITYGRNALKILGCLGRRELQRRKVILVVVDREYVFLGQFSYENYWKNRRDLSDSHLELDNSRQITDENCLIRGEKIDF